MKDEKHNKKDENYVPLNVVNLGDSPKAINRKILEEYKTYQKTNNDVPKKKNKLDPKVRFKIIMATLVIAISMCCFLFSPFFNIETVNISKMETYSEDEITKMIPNIQNVNAVFLNKSAIKNELYKNPYFEKVNINCVWPSTVNIDITERKPRGYLPYLGSYLYIDENGLVLGSSEYFIKPLPVIKGLEFDNFTVGEHLEIDNDQLFDIMVNFSKIFAKYNLLDIVVEVDVSDPKNLSAYVNNVDVNFGDSTRLDEKIRTMVAAISELESSDKGSLDLTNLDKPIVFKYLL